MKNSVVLGHGVVGKATMRELGIENFQSRLDANLAKSLFDYEYVFLCLPTPTVDGKCDIHLVEDYIKNISMGNPNAIFIVRSTVIPGTCRRLAKEIRAKIVHVPEFLTEATWDTDADWPDIIVVGSDDKETRDKVLGIFKARHKGSEFFTTDLTTAETIKYAVNTFYSLKVIFANQLYDFCQNVGVNYEQIKGAMYKRAWIGRNHLDVWHKNKRGAGGKCLEKDLEAFANLTKLPILELANKLNKSYLKSNETSG